MDDEIIQQIIRIAIGRPSRLADAQVRVRGKRTGYRSAWAVSTRERVVCALYRAGMRNKDIQELMRYRSSGTVSRILYRMGMGPCHEID
jgi:DNA-binding NarL/FixJ family response regulator